YTAIYSGFAILLLFMIWLYLGWLILLIGASIAFYHQHPEKVQWDDESIAISAVMRENLAFQLMLEIGLQYSLPDGFVPTRKNLAARLKIPQVMTVGMLNNLESFGLIARSAEIESRYLLLQDSEKIKLIDILRAARNADDKGLQNQLQKAAVVSQLQLDIERSLQQLLAEKTLKDLILQSRGPVNENSNV
ncbi:MAG: Rrf2 family transcriptional regulator, partial [Gammaproteobacteria bacterium]|nr:Rrf2 family transcriptional regulator [Gammaproteobacteria bacterium]